MTRLDWRVRSKEEPLNPEGLSWAEWACAAGVAKFQQRQVPFAEPTVVGEFLRRRDGQFAPWGFSEYGHDVLRAWSAGEDPTEWRAAQARAR